MISIQLKAQFLQPVIYWKWHLTFCDGGDGKKCFVIFPCIFFLELVEFWNQSIKLWISNRDANIRVNCAIPYSFVNFNEIQIHFNKWVTWEPIRSRFWQLIILKWGKRPFVGYFAGKRFLDFCRILTFIPQNSKNNFRQKQTSFSHHTSLEFDSDEPRKFPMILNVSQFLLSFFP